MDGAPLGPGRRQRPVGPSPVEEIRLVACFTREAGHRFSTGSMPGHLLQLTLAGAAQQTCNGRVMTSRAGDVVWYHEDEQVQGEVIAAPWRFVSVNFTAPALPPPGEAERLFPAVGRVIHERFAALATAWGREPADAVRALALHAELQAILVDVLQRLPGDPVTAPASGRGGLWWWLEARVRQQLPGGMDLAELARSAGVSPATVARACRQATGMPPGRRLRDLRLGYARGLVRLTAQPIGSIALRLGFPRIHEFSRAYRQRFGLPPTHDRAGNAGAVA